MCPGSAGCPVDIQFSVAETQPCVCCQLHWCEGVRKLWKVVVGGVVAFFFFCSNSLKVFQIVPIKLIFSYKVSVFNVLFFHFLKSGLGDQ